MSDRPTQETDAELNIYLRHGEAHQVSVPWIEFARKLERERDEARNLADKFHCDQVTLLRERDEAREALKHIGEYGTEEINAAVELRQKLATALVERDEARDICEKLSKQGLDMMDENRSLKRERDEAREELAILRSNKMSDPLLETTFKHLNHERDKLREDANQLADRLTALELHSTSELARLEKERDEARIDAKKSKAYKRVLKEANANLKRERDEALSQIVQAECRAERFCQERDEARDKAERCRLEANAMMMQRDEAREKIEQQRKEIVRLNGATNHAGGTPLKIALRERDEAREDLEFRRELYKVQDKYLDDARRERDEAQEKLSARWQSLRDSQDEVLRLTFENRGLSQSIEGWENKWKCAIDMAARAELERDEALKCAKEYYIEFIRNASSENKVSKPNPLNPFYKLT